MGLIKWTKPNTSDVIALISLAISIWLAFSANSLAEKANLLSSRASVPRIQISNMEVESSTDIRYGLLKAAENDFSGLQITVSGDISSEYGKLSKLYLVNYEVLASGLKIENIDLKKTSYKEEEFDINFNVEIQSLGLHERIRDRFYLISVDSSKKIHLTMIVVEADSAYSLKISDMEITDGVYFYEKNIFYDSENQGIDYEVFDDFDLFGLRDEEILKEVDEIHQVFSKYGFSR